MAVLRPSTTEQVSRIVRHCADHDIAVVPQGGNTGMSGGATPLSDKRQIVLNLGRMSRVLDIDPIDLTMVVEAGITLKGAQEAAEQAGCYFPLSIASEGTAQLGGVLATNAGGINTVRYGNARDLVLGLQVVLADGEVWNGLRRLRKDNTGYCLRQLFVGSEGTLGIITAASLKLLPSNQAVETVFCALPSADAALSLFSRMQKADAAALQSFEIVEQDTLEIVLKHIPGATRPLPPAPYYALIEWASPQRGKVMRERLEHVLEIGMANGLVTDAVFAETHTQRQSLWKLREGIAEAQNYEAPTVKNDVSVPVSKTAEFIRRASAACKAAMPGVRVIVFGHMGDGNIHFNLMKSPEMDTDEFKRCGPSMIDIVNDVVETLGGSFSAEHGIGQLKVSALSKFRSGTELDVMLRLKKALDPRNSLNPGKLFREADR